MSDAAATALLPCVAQVKSTAWMGEHQAGRRDGDLEKQNSENTLVSSSGQYCSNSERNGTRVGHGDRDVGCREEHTCYDSGGRDEQYSGNDRYSQDDFSSSQCSRTIQTNGSPSCGPSSGETLYELSITVSGRGLDPDDRSHWASMICRAGESFGDRLHVTLLDLQSLTYMFEVRSAVSLRDNQCEGRCTLAVWNSQQRQGGIKLIQNEPVPRDGRSRCQDWVLEVLTSLNIEDVIPTGTLERWNSVIGEPSAEVAAVLGSSWDSFSAPG